jgi:hypothetical protein
MEFCVIARDRPVSVLLFEVVALAAQAIAAISAFGSSGFLLSLGISLAEALLILAISRLASGMARWAWTIIFLLGFAVIVLGLIVAAVTRTDLHISLVSGVLSAVTMAMNLLCAYLIWTPAASDWIGTRKVSK